MQPQQEGMSCKRFESPSISTRIAELAAGPAAQASPDSPGERNSASGTSGPFWSWTVGKGIGGHVRI